MNTNKKVILSLATMFALGSSTLCASTVYATVNGEDITKDDIAIALKNQRVDFEKLPEQTKTEILNQLIERKLLIKEAKKSGIERDKKFKDALERVKEDLGLEVWMQKKFTEVKTTEKEIKDFYNKNKDKFITPERLKAKHILVKTENEAKAIIKELNSAKMKLAKFEELAKAKSADKASAKNGGSLGEFVANQMVPEFSKAANALKKGTYSKTPVKSQFGYHVIFLEDKKPSSALSFDDVKGQIKNVVAQEKFKESIKKTVDSIKKSAKITIK